MAIYIHGSPEPSPVSKRNKRARPPCDYERGARALLRNLRGSRRRSTSRTSTRERLAPEEAIRKGRGESARQFVKHQRQSRAAQNPFDRAAPDLLHT